ncbi:MAG: outer membrane beta-barrel protein [Cyclobacteriaceae bacterium]
MFKQVVLGVLLSIVSSFAFAQNFLSWQLNDRYFTTQVGAGFASYRGELKHNGSIQNEISNLSLGVEARLLPKIGVRFEVGRYNIRGHDKHAPDSSFAKQRNLSFKSANYEASIQGIFFLNKYAANYTKRPKCDPYLLLGIGGTYISPTTTLGGEKYNLFDTKTESTDYNRLTLIIPAGAGLKWKINPFTNLSTEITYRYTFSDFLDDVSGDFPESYPDITTELLSNRKDEIPMVNQAAYDQLIPGSPRGDDNNKDAYLFLNFKLEWYFPPDLFAKKK